MSKGPSQTLQAKAGRIPSFRIGTCVRFDPVSSEVAAKHVRIKATGNRSSLKTGSCEMAPSTLAQWFGAVGTIAAVIVALFKDPILAWKRRPSLDVTCSTEIPWTVKMPSTAWQGRFAGGGVWKGDRYFVRIKVENFGKTRAEKVQVSASKLAKRGADNKFMDIPTILPLNLRWSNSPPGEVITILDGISSKMSAFCDVIALWNPENPYQRRPEGTPENVTVGHLQLEVDPPTDTHLLPPATYRLTIRIAAANVEPIDRIIEFTHTGTWTQHDVSMRRDCLGVSQT